ncbi:MAG: MBL fold metallo-hydrolase, partial [Sedimentisphaerales bacterium]|nr:MBL fold metallo-hydrolase [Sedimentisphaerales bacterium]
MKLSLEQIRDFQVPASSLGLWWLGQAGFIIKSPSGVVAVLDAYLSDSCGPLAKDIGFDFSRSYPPPMEAGELAGVDVYMLSHSHQDHLDPDTIAACRACGGRGPYVAPHHAAAKLVALGVKENEIIRTWPGNCVSFKDLEIRATFAVPFSDDDLTHVGYAVGVGGVSIYFTGDTAYHEVVGISALAY